MKPYAELLEFNQPNPIRWGTNSRIREAFPALDTKRQIDGVTFSDPELVAEFAGRWDYGAKNAAKLGQPSKPRTVTLRDPETDQGYEYRSMSMIQKWINSGEQSMLEMGHATVFIECSRVVSHELVRHRLASFQQESQRFSVFVIDDIDEGFFIPPNLDPLAEEAMREQYASAVRLYSNLLEIKVPKQIARYVLPGATRTRIIVSANMREWRHIIKLRLHPSAQPEMRELMRQIYDQLVEVFPQSLAGVIEEGRGVR